MFKTAVNRLIASYPDSKIKIYAARFLKKAGGAAHIKPNKLF